MRFASLRYIRGHFFTGLFGNFFQMEPPPDTFYLAIDTAIWRWDRSLQSPTTMAKGEWLGCELGRNGN